MTSLSESFDQPDSTTIGPDQTWVTGVNDSSETYSQAFSNSSSTGGYAYALVATPLTDRDQTVTVTVAAFDDTGGNSFQIFLRDLEDPENGTLTAYGFWSAVLDSNGGTASAYINVETTDGGIYFTSAAQSMTPLSVSDTIEFSVTGEGLSASATLKVNGNTVITGGTSELVSYGGLADVSTLPDGDSRVGLALLSHVAHGNRIDGLTSEIEVTPTFGTVFTPPSRNGVPPILPDWSPREFQTRTAARLFRHYRSRPEGVNVYLLSDNTVTEDDPDGERVVWSQNDKVGALYVTVAWYGGHDGYILTDEQAQILSDAGYSAYIS